MVGRPKKITKQKQTADTTKITKLVLKQTTQKSTENLEEDNENFNISQIEPEKLK